MARVAIALCLLLALAAARAAPADFDPEEAESEVQEEEEEAPQEEERLGQEEPAPVLDYERWTDDAAADSYAFQEPYNLRGNSEPLTQQVEDAREWEADSLSRLTSEAQSEQQYEQQRGQLQEQQRGQLQQQEQEQQRGQLQQQEQQQSGRPDRLQEQSTPRPDSQPGAQPDSGYNPSRERDRDFGIVGNNGDVRRPQPGSQNPESAPPQRPGSQNPESAPPQRPGSGQGSPPAGYTRLGFFGHFKVVIEPRTWPEALITCLSDGAQLAVPTSEEEARTVGQFYGKEKNKVKKSTDKDLFFIGASDLVKEGTFVTLLGTTLGDRQWVRWQKGEPNNHKKVEHCVLSNETGFYWDGNCQNKYAFVCEWKDKCRPGSPRYDSIQQSADLQQQTRS